MLQCFVINWNRFKQWLKQAKTVISNGDNDDNLYLYSGCIHHISGFQNGLAGKLFTIVQCKNIYDTNIIYKNHKTNIDKSE